MNRKLTTGDKEMLTILAIVVLVLLWLWYRSGGAQALTQPGMSDTNWSGAGNPWNFVNPGFPNPTSDQVTPAPITINVPSPVFSGLGQYFPLFGFVGVDARSFYQ